MSWITLFVSRRVRGFLGALMAMQAAVPAVYAQDAVSGSLAPLRTDLTIQATNSVLGTLPSITSIRALVAKLEALNPARPVPLVLDRSLFENSSYDAAAALAALRDADARGLIRIILVDRGAADADEAATRLDQVEAAMHQAMQLPVGDDRWIHPGAVDQVLPAAGLTRVAINEAAQFGTDAAAAKPGTISAGYRNDQIQSFLDEDLGRQDALRQQNPTVLQIAFEQAQNAAAQYETQIRAELLARGASPMEIAGVLGALREAANTFTLFQTRVQGREQYLIGHHSALAVDFLEFLVSEAHRRHQEQLATDPQARVDYSNVAEYILHEALERVESLQHRDIIDITATLLGRPAVTTPGGTPLGREIRRFIDKRAAELVISAHLKAGVISNDPRLVKTFAHRRPITDLMDMQQYHLFAGWDEPGVNDSKKFGMLEQLLEMDRSYVGGLKAYRANAQRIVSDAIKGVNRLKGIRPSVADGTVVPDMGTDEFSALEQEGLAAANKLGFVLVAGGLGDRLGYDGIKVDIPIDLATHTTYLRYYIESILAFQAKSNAINGENLAIPLTIMTSDDTDALTRQVLAQNNNFGLAEGQIRIVKQGKMPSFDSADADLLLKAGDPYTVQSKPHGHGDIHKLLHDNGVVRDAVESGRTHTVVIQDTNAQAMNAVLSSLAVSLRDGLNFNVITVTREAGEATGSIVRASRDGEPDDVRSIEYGDLAPLLAAVAAEDMANQVVGVEGLGQLASDLRAGLFSVSQYRNADGKKVAFPAPRMLGMLQRLIEEGQAAQIAGWYAQAFSVDEMRAELHRLWEATPADNRPLLGGDQKDPATGLSPYAANLNVFIIRNEPYAEILQTTGGQMPEFAQPKFIDPANPLLGMKAPTRLETMMQDIMPQFKRVGVTVYRAKREVFSPVKNNPVDGAGKVKSGNYPDAMATGEADFYAYQRRLLQQAGVAINVEGTEQRTMHGVPYRAGARVVLMPEFVQTVAEAKAKIHGESVTDRSEIVVRGPLENLTFSLLDGALEVQAVEGVNLTFDFPIQNQGGQFVPLGEEKTAPPQLRVRGYALQMNEKVTVIAGEPGDYVLTAADIPGPGVYEIRGGKVVRTDAPSTQADAAPASGASTSAPDAAPANALEAARALRDAGVIDAAVIAPAQAGVGAPAIEAALDRAVTTIETTGVVPVVYAGAAAAPAAPAPGEDWLALVTPEALPGAELLGITAAVTSLLANQTST